MNCKNNYAKIMPRPKLTFVEPMLYPAQMGRANKHYYSDLLFSQAVPLKHPLSVEDPEFCHEVEVNVGQTDQHILYHIQYWCYKTKKAN